VYGLSSFSLAANIHSRWIGGGSTWLFRVYCGILGLTATWGILVIDVSWNFDATALDYVLSLPIGLSAGVFAIWSDRTIIRAVNRRMKTRNQRRPRQRRLASVAFQALPQRINPHRPSLVIHYPRNRVRQNYYQVIADARHVGLWLLLAIAVLEEFVYRGLFIGLCFLLPNGGFIAVALIGNMLAFSLSHVWFGWPHVLAKVPLSVTTTAATLAMGTILPAIIAHLLFNTMFWKDMRLPSSFVSRFNRGI